MKSMGWRACKLLLVLLPSLCLIVFVSLPTPTPTPYPSSKLLSPAAITPTPSPTTLQHLVFGILGSERAWHRRKHYTESWWRPNATRGILYLDKAPSGDLLPWSAASPPYRISDNLDEFLPATKANSTKMIRLVHAIVEVMREMEKEGEVRWVVMGDDDSIFMVDNMVGVLAELDHSKYYYVGGPSESIMSNYWFSFNLGFGGGGYMMSYPLARAVANDMENCLTRHGTLRTADLVAMNCIADIGVNLSPHHGIHQIDLRGDLSGFLSSHPKSPLISLHHFDIVEPIFPGKDRYESTRHLMKAAAVDQSRMLQQTICHHRQSNWSISISWGYSAHVYEKIMARSDLMNPVETFAPWSRTARPRPHYMFNTRLAWNNSCNAPHVFFFKEVNKGLLGILTTYSRAAPRGLRSCLSNTADLISEIRVVSPTTDRKQMDRCECCDVIAVTEKYAELKLRECMMSEVIA